jgi:hypothetical protein
MEQYNLNLPSKEFVENNFNRIFNELAALKKQLKPSKNNAAKYYRNKDLKEIFGLSDNTIYAYRAEGIIPFTKLGEIFYYPVAEIDRILANNASYGKLNNA